MKTIKLLMFLMLICTAQIFAQGTMKVHILDVGQGSAALIELPCGVIMIDTGGEVNDDFKAVDSLMKQMKTIFSTRPNKNIDLLILSHPHKDHTLGVKQILKNFKVRNVITNGLENGSGKSGQIALHKAVSDTEATPATTDDIGYFEAVADDIGANGISNAVIDPFTCVDIKILWGQLKDKTLWGKTDFSNGNNHSVVCRIDFGGSSILFTGDIETKAIKTILAKYQGGNLLDTDVYVASHHGARNGTTPEFAAKIAPEIAIMSFGDPDRELSWTAFAYGHPNQGIVDHLSNNVSKNRLAKIVMVGDSAEHFHTETITKAVYGVGWDGAIDLEADNSGNWRYIERNPLINVNTATLDVLTKKLRLKKNVAQAVITFRATNSLQKLEDLDRVTGIGPATLKLLSGLVKFQD